MFEELRTEIDDENDAGIDSDELMATSIHRTLVRNFVATQTSVLLPVRVPWVLLNIEWNDNLRKAATQVKTMLSNEQRSILQRFDRMGVRSAYYAALEHAAVASHCAMHFRQEDKLGRDRVRLFGLRQIVIQRQDQTIRKLIVKESEDLAPDEASAVPESSQNKVSAKPRQRHWYTEIDYQAGTVKQEIDGKIKNVKDDNPKRWVVIDNEPPKPGRHYSNAFVTNHIHTIIQLDTLHRIFDDLGAEAAFFVIWTRPGSGIAPMDRAKLEKLGGAVCIELPDEKAMGVITGMSQSVAAAMQWVHTRILEIEQQLRKDFLHGLLEAKGQIKTATHVREIVAEMESVGSQHYAYHQDHSLLPMAEALLDMDGIKQLEVNGVKITPTILTGVSALTQQEESEALLAILVQLGQVYPEEIRQLPFGNVFKRLAAPFHIETEDLLGEGSAVIDLLKELVMKAKADPQGSLPMIRQALSLLGGGGGGGSTAPAQGGIIGPNGQPAQQPGEAALTQAA